MSRKVKKWLRSYPSARRLENMDFATFSLGLCYLLSFPTWRWEMRRKVKKWLKSYPSAGRSVKMDFPTIFCFPTWRWEMSRKVKKGLKS